MKLNNSLKFLFSIVICQLAGVIGGIFTSSSVSTWYMELKKPFFNPPNWIFSPVWITLYFLMGLSLFIVWKKGIKTKKSKVALTIFAIQLFLNILWSLFFFGLRLPLLAFVEILVLWIFILLSVIHFYRISKIASYLLIPYILWVSFAAILNFYLWIFN